MSKPHTPEQIAHAKAYNRAWRARKMADPAYADKRREDARKHQRELRKKDPEIWAVKAREWRARHPDAAAKARDANPVVVLLRGAEARAKQRGMEFRIGTADVGHFPSHCPILGVPLDRSGSGTEFVPTIDRMDSRFGYVPGNVWVISKRANTIKNCGTAAEHEAIARAMRGRGLP